MKSPASVSVPPSARTWNGTTGSSMNRETNTVNENIHMVMNGPVKSGSLEEVGFIEGAAESMTGAAQGVWRPWR